MDTHKLFRFGISVKGIDGILESIGGLFLIFLKPGRFTSIISQVFSHELSEDPADLIANYLLNVSPSGQRFSAAYMIIHGLVKIGIVWGLWKGYRKAYPIAAIVLGIMILFEVARYVKTGSIVLLAFIAVDIIILALMRSEYKGLHNT